MKCRILFFAILLISPFFVLGQNLRRISNAEGLSNSSILSLGQDANGYIWAGSCDGINLWDGSYAHTYKLSGNLIQEIFPTDDGYLWIRTNYGIDRLDIRDNSLEQHTDFPRIYHFAARSRDEAFFVHGNSLYGYLPGESRFERITDSEELGEVRSVYFDREDFLWLLGGREMSYIPVSRGEEGRPQLGAPQRIPMPNGISFACYDGDRSIYFTDNDDVLYRFDTGRRQAFSVCDMRQEVAQRGDISAIIRDGDDYVVAFEMNGAVRLHSTARIEGQYVLQEIAVDCGVFALLKDRNQDIVWIGTDGSGLLRLSDGDVTARSVTYGDLPYPLSKPIKSLFVDRDGDLWIGTKNDGILRIDDFYRCRDFTRSNTQSFTMANSALRRNSVYCFAESRRPVLWIGGDGGVSYYSYVDKKIHLLARSEALRNVYSLLEGDDSTLWAATVGAGVFRISLTPKPAAAPCAACIEPVELGLKGRERNFFFSICRESDSILWFGNHGEGAVRYNTRSRSGDIVRFDDRRGLAVNDVTAITRCSDNTLWFATGCGVERCNPSGPLPVPEYNHDILRNGVIHGLVTDSLDNVWISTNAGVVRYNPHTNRSVSYGSTYGLGVVEFSDGAYFYDRRAETLLFGGINGFVVISDTEAPVAGTYMPPIQFREVTISGVTYGVSGLMRGDRLTLNHRQRAFSLSLVALDYINGSNYSYLYNIEGLDDKWNDNRHNNQLVFANMLPGRYTLNVRYRNNMTGELSPVSRLGIRILPAPYASVWAWVIYVVVFAALFAGAAGYWIRRRRKRALRRRELYEQRQKELLYESRIWSFANLTNELSIPLTLINGPCRQIMDHKSADGFIHRQAEFIERNVQKINDLIYMLNEFKYSGPADRADDIELLDVSRFAESVALTFDEYARANGIDLHVLVEDGLVFPSARNGLTMVLNILLNNAFRRTQSGGEVTLRVLMEGEVLRIEVANRGEELDRERMELIFDRYRMFDYFEDLSRKGLSLKDDMELAICRNLVLKLQGELRVVSGDGVTTFSVGQPRLEITRISREGLQPDIEPERRFNLPLLSVRTEAKPSASLPTMLVINDDRDMTDFIADLFVGAYNVGMVDDLNEVSEYLRESHPQIIICGAVSLNGDLIGTIRRIRQNKQLAQIPIILLTAASRADIKIEGLELGVDICLTLPFDITHLRSVADQLLRKYESLKDYGRSIFSSFDLTHGRMLHKDDRAFLDKMLAVIRNNILNTELSTQFIAEQMGMSLCNLYRKLGAVTDQTPAAIIRECRLCLAEQQLLTTKLSIDEVIYKSGFANRSTFFRSFIARFGCTPKIYREQKIREAMDQNPI